MHLHSRYEPISPPRQVGSPYITPEGEQALRAELHALWEIERPEVTKAVSAAAANGDRRKTVTTFTARSGFEKLTHACGLRKRPMH